MGITEELYPVLYPYQGIGTEVFEERDEAGES